MKKIIFLTLLIFLSNCTLKKVVHHHGVHNLEQKQLNLRINQSNTNDVIKLIGPPSTRSKFDNDLFIYIERKTTGSKLTRLGKKKLIANNVLLLEFDNTGVLINKKFFNKDQMNKIKFDEYTTSLNYTKRSFVNDFLFSLRQRIDDPLGKKRVRND